MQAKITWNGKASQTAISGSGHTIEIDGPPEAGGKNRGARPMELLLLGLGGCTQFDVIHILTKARQRVTGCEVELTAERADKPPQVFTRIHVHFKISGQGLAGHQVDRAVRLSAEKYCSASIMLAKTARITHDWEIVEA